MHPYRAPNPDCTWCAGSGTIVALFVFGEQEQDCPDCFPPNPPAMSVFWDEGEEVASQ